jgi:hypothetical protein
LNRQFPLGGTPKRPRRPPPALTIGLPLMTADKEIIEWNKAHSAIQILKL